MGIEYCFFKIIFCNLGFFMFLNRFNTLMSRIPSTTKIIYFQSVYNVVHVFYLVVWLKIQSVYKK
jgi:hypothetical protein